jgi:nicotinate-nucleotide adenylyltransferase
LFWIIGSDQLEYLSQWHRINDLVQKVRFIMLMRPGYRLDWPGIPGLFLYLVDNPLLDISSTEVRDRIRNRQPIAGLVPAQVEHYIAANQLYA